MLALLALALFAKPDIVLADFEGPTYGNWTTTGTAFGTGPVQGTLPNQMRVSGFQGKGLVNSFHGGDGSTGTLTSPEFTIERGYIGFLIGGGKNLQDTCMNLIVEGKIVRQATGPNDRPGGSEALRPEGWNVRDLLGKKARIEIVDRATGGWGHINVDHIVLTDRKPPIMLQNPERTIPLDKQYLLFPIKRDAPRRLMTLTFEGGLTTTNSVSIADGEPDWWASIDVSQYKGKTATLRFDELIDESNGLKAIKTSDSLPGLYKEAYRPQYHFTAKSGWLNDPNGLAYYNGEYHMFFQHDPMGGGTDYKLWGHAVSKDLVHWKELPDALYPDELGSMWSGSAVVDWKNTSGFGKDGKPPLVLIYTAAGNPSSQCIAYSTDGRTFTKYKGNPVIPQITGYNRDPKVIWHEPTQKWIMTLYVEHDGTHYIEFFNSPDLIHWTFTSRTAGFFECPDFFELEVQGTREKKWVLSAANTDYMVGTFDGRTFTPETPKIKGIFGTGYYAPQTFSDTPDGRRIQVGWMWTSPPNMPFTQSMSIPMELSLVRKGSTYEMLRKPVPELNLLEDNKRIVSMPIVGSGAPDFEAEASRVHLDLSEANAETTTITLRGAKIVYRGDTRELDVAGSKLQLEGDKITLDIFVDRVGLEVFANGKYIPSPFIPNPSDMLFTMSCTNAKAKISGSFATMKSVWK